MAKKKKKVGVIIGVIGLLTVLLVATAIFIGGKLGEESFMSVKLFDKNKNPVGELTPGTMSIVGGVPNVWYISILVTATHNLGDRDITNLQIISATPTELWVALPSTAYTLSPGGTVEWESELIGVQQFEGQTVEFSVVVEGDDEYLQEVISNSGSISFTVEEETPVGFGVEIGSSVGEPEIPAETEMCGDDVCEGSETEMNCPEDCYVAPPPASCTVEFRTSCTGDYSGSGNCEIVMDRDNDGVLECYTYNTYYSSFSVGQSTKITTTPEGHNVYQYSADRIIIDIGSNYIYQPGTCSVPTSLVPTEPYSSNGQEICV